MNLGARGVVVGGGPHNAEGGDQLVTMYSTGEYGITPTLMLSEGTHFQFESQTRPPTSLYLRAISLTHPTKR